MFVHLERPDLLPASAAAIAKTSLMVQPTDLPEVALSLSAMAGLYLRIASLGTSTADVQKHKANESNDDTAVLAGSLEVLSPNSSRSFGSNELTKRCRLLSAVSFCTSLSPWQWFRSSSSKSGPVWGTASGCIVPGLDHRLEWKAGTALATTGTYLCDLRTHLLHRQRSTSTASFHFAGFGCGASKYHCCKTTKMLVFVSPCCRRSMETRSVRHFWSLCWKRKGWRERKEEREQKEGSDRQISSLVLGSDWELPWHQAVWRRKVLREGFLRRIFGFWAENSNDAMNARRNFMDLY